MSNSNIDAIKSFRRRRGEQMRTIPCFLLLLPFLVFHNLDAAAPNVGQWLTLSGKQPAVIARGGCSGVFPESGGLAQKLAASFGIPGNTILYCDLQLSKDGVGFCHSDLRLDNYTTIGSVYPKGQKTYTVGGAELRGWFTVDYTSNELLSDVSLVQSIFSRPDAFDATEPLGLLEDLPVVRPDGVWINVQYPTFFKEHNLDVVNYLVTMKKTMRIDYVSSPDVAFLKALGGKLADTKLVMQFLDRTTVESTTKKTYGSLLEDLPGVKQFASGILVPKTLVWPIGTDNYLQPHTTLVDDAHKLGLEVYASGFANDMSGSYNYSYDPTAEYLQFIDNSAFSVDGVLTDFPSTASEAIACLAHNTKDDAAPAKGAPMVITHNGASGEFAGCTDLAYKKAVEDGADVIDCSVQMSKDGTPFCLESPDLAGSTDAAVTFAAKSAVIPEIQEENGIYSFDLTWSEIQSLKPSLKSPYFADSHLARNPAAKNQGKLMLLSEFLDFAKEQKVPGILINIQNAAYIASKKGLGLTDAVIAALTKAGYDKDAGKMVLIQSDDSSVLSKFKQFPTYKRVLKIEEVVSGAAKPAIDEIKKVADAVNLPRSSIVKTNAGFLLSWTGIVDDLHAANLSVYVSVLRNEFVAIAFDFFADPVLELATYAHVVGVDGYVTEFPATAAAYIRSPCFDPDAKLPYTIPLVFPGNMLGLAAPEALPPAAGPAPLLEAADVVDPPLPEVADMARGVEKEQASSPSSNSPHSSGQRRFSISTTSVLLLLILGWIGLST